MRNISVRVRIGAERSRTVTMHQGVGQGRIPSNEQYKLHLNDLLCTLETSAFHCGSLTCADDVMLLSDTSKDLQAQLNITTDYARRQRYQVNPTKTTISEYPDKRRTTHEHPSWDSDVTPTDQFTHLGIIRTAGKFSPDAIIDARIQLARRTRYSLMGAGLHGSNGISPVVAWSMYATYVLQPGSPHSDAQPNSCP